MVTTKGRRKVVRVSMFLSYAVGSFMAPVFWELVERREMVRTRTWSRCVWACAAAPLRVGTMEQGGSCAVLQQG
jgi:hypothetical protein